MRAILLLAIIFSSVTFCNTNDTTSFASAILKSGEVKVFRSGNESTVDSVVQKNQEIFIYIDGNKIPIIKNKKSYRQTPTTPLPDSVIVKKDHNSDSSKVITAGTNNDMPWWAYVLSVLGVLVLGFVLTKSRASISKDGSNTDRTSNTTSASATQTQELDTNNVKQINSESTDTGDNSILPSSNLLLNEDNRMIFNPDYEPAYPDMPSWDKLNKKALPSMVQQAYLNTPNFKHSHGVIVEVLEIKHGRLNGRFAVEHRNGTVTIQSFVNEKGFRAKVRLSSGIAYVYTRYGCLNNVRGIDIVEISEEPTFTPDPETRVSNGFTETKVFEPENVPTNIAIESVEERPRYTLPSSSPTITVTINGHEVTASPEQIKELLK